MTDEIKIIFTPSFRRMTKKLNLNVDDVKSKIGKELQVYVDENPESLHFPDSGAGIGNVWKIRINGRGGYRAIYFAYPRTREFYFILIYAKSKQTNLTNAQIIQIRKFVKELENLQEG